MSLNVIGAGVGRSGTYSLKLALEQLGLGPCHHMEEVIFDAPRQVPLWQSAVDGKPDWDTIFAGYNSAVDWPTAAFWQELAARYPQSKVILTVRSPESWHESFSSTIYKLIAGRADAPPHMRDWFTMGVGCLLKTGVREGLDRDALIAFFNDHVARVKAAIPANRLLVLEIKDGWEPLCAFLGKPVPATPFPQTNTRSDFWDRLKDGPPA